MYELTPTVVCETAADVMALARTVDARRKAQRRPVVRPAMPVVVEAPPEPAPVVRPSVAVVALDTAVMATAAGAENWPSRQGVIRAIQMVVCEHYKVPLYYLTHQGRRFAPIMRPRLVGMYLCRKLTDRSMPQIAKQFGLNDHTTVLSGCRSITAKMATDEMLACEIEYLTGIIRGGQ